LKDSMKSGSLVHFVADIAVDKKGSTITILDLRKISTMVDYFVIITASSDIHARAIADEISRKLRKKGIHRWHIEGYAYGHWILVDYVDVVVHIFLEDARAYYNVESLWGDAPMEKVEIEHE
jgi:ribosome-associated protein